VYVARNSQVSLSWHERSGRFVSAVPLDGLAGWPAVAPHDRRVAVDVRNPTSDVPELVIVDSDRREKITFGPVASGNAVWSPDGRRIVYESDVGRELRELTLDTKQTRTLKSFDGISDSVYPMDWSRDNRWIAYVSYRAGNEDVWLYPTTPGEQPQPLASSSFHEGSARFSPDSRFVAYRSSEYGRPGVYLQAVPPAVGRWSVAEGGAQPMWRADGRELYYIGANNLLMAVPIALGPEPSIGTPTPLFKLQIAESTSVAVRNHYAVTSDGQRFLVRSVTGGATLNVILNWRSALDTP
jgi:Tol biopolymer transport system component